MTTSRRGRADVDVIVVGAGLAGLTAASDLVDAGGSVLVVDGRTRVGGRTMTVVPESGRGWFDLGATWHWADQPGVRSLAAALGVKAFAEPTEGLALHERAGAPAERVQLPPSPAAFLRLAGGAEQLCRRLADGLPGGSLALGEKVVEVDQEGDAVVVSSDIGDDPLVRHTAAHVVVAVPPRLVLQEVVFTPALPDELVAVMEATPTWMGEALKSVAVYDSPFWRDDGLSGSAFSESGPLEEVHDASVPGGPAALWGFVALDADFRGIGPDERVPLVLDQLGRLFGRSAADPVQYLERDWSADPYTCEDQHRHVTPVPYGHPSFSLGLWDDRLWWAGTETEVVGGGHMEGAVRSGRRAARSVAARLQRTAI